MTLSVQIKFSARITHKHAKHCSVFYKKCDLTWRPEMIIMDLKKHKETSTQVLARFDLKFSLSSIMKIIIIDEHILRFSNKLLIVLTICLLFFQN